MPHCPYCEGKKERKWCRSNTELMKHIREEHPKHLKPPKGEKHPPNVPSGLDDLIKRGKKMF